MSQELMPPQTEQLPVLSPPEAVKPVAAEEADRMVKLEPATVEKLNRKVAEFVDAVVSLEVHSEGFKEKVASVHALGNAEIRAAASVSNRLLERPAKAMETGLFDEGSQISKSLVELRRTIEDLDPSTQGDLLTPKKLLGIFPFGNKLRDYFARYQSSQTHLNGIIQALYNGQDELRKDNAAIEQEKANLWEIMQKLEQYAHVGKQIDAALAARIETLKAQDAEKARVVQEEMLFYVRQKVQDLLTQLAVSVQGYLSLDMIRKNNLELIKAVDRATTTTVSALRTAVIVAQALANQKLVLDQVTALNTTTGNLIQATSEMMKKQAAEIAQQASSATVSLDKLKQAFQNIYATMDMLADYKVKALGAMAQTVEALSTEVEKSKTYVDRVRSAEADEATSALEIVEADDIWL